MAAVIQLTETHKIIKENRRMCRKGASLSFAAAIDEPYVGDGERRKQMDFRRDI